MLKTADIFYVSSHVNDARDWKMIIMLQDEIVSKLGNVAAARN